MKDLRIVRLSTSTEEEKSVLMPVYNLIKGGILGFEIQEPKEEYMSDGLKFDISYLNSLGKALIMFPVEDIVKYVDQTTKTFVDSKSAEFIELVVSSLNNINIEDENQYDPLNATSIGNIAYVMENCNTANIREKCETILNSILQKEFNKSLNLLNSTSFGIGVNTSHVEDQTIKETKSENIGLLIKELQGLDETELYQITRILKEYKRAKSKHPVWPEDIIHASAVLSEESGELVKATLQYVYEEGKLNEADNEAVQVGAMALRFLSNVYKYKNNDGELLN